jgi:hypothetical protein
MLAGIDEHGRPAADPRVERVARIVTIVACVFFAVAACWGMAAPFGSGHFASTAARGIVAENMWEWGILAPVREYVLTRPTQAQYYAHHPFGIFWLVGLAYELFGRHDLICRLPALLMSLACPPLLWGIGRAIWGPVAGALAAAGFVVLPISLSFAGFAGFELPVIFGALLVSWTYVRFSQTWKRRWLLGSVAALLFSVNSDWEIFVFLAVVLGVLALGGLILPRGWFGTVDVRRFAQWWVLAAAISVLGGAFWIVLFRHYGHLEDLLGSHSVRSAGNEASLSAVLESRKHWIELMFTPLAILIGKLAVFVLLIRFLLLRRVLEVFPLAILAMSIFHYVHFKQGADVHIYWPQVFAPYFALALAVLGASFERGIGWLVARLSRRQLVRVPAYVALGLFVLVPLAIVPDGLSVLRYGHHTGFRFNEKGNPIRQDLDKAAALRWMSARLEGRAIVELHRSMDYTWSQEWNLHRPIVDAPKLPTPGKRAARYFIADSRKMAAADQQQLADGFHVTAVGTFWLVDYEALEGPIEAFAIEARKPSLLQRYLVAPVDPIYQIVPDPFRTWELRDHFAQTPNPMPEAAPETADQRRIGHNLSVARGDHALAARLRQEIVQELDRAIATALDDGSELIGSRHDELRHELWIYVRAAGPTKAAQTFQVRASVEEKKPLSLIAPDEVQRRIDGLLELDTTLWKKDYVYVIRFEVRPRLGREAFEGFFTARGGAPLRPVGGGARLRLLTTH